MRAWSRAILMSAEVGSMAVMDAACVTVWEGLFAFVGIVRARDSAKMPPPQPTSR